MAAICIQVINPNTNPGMTDTIATAARMAAALGTEIMAVSAREGCRPSKAILMRPLPPSACWSRFRPAASRAFRPRDRLFRRSDCWRPASWRRPVIGIAEAAMHLATLVATRFSIVTTLPRTLIIARHLLHQYGFYDRCSGLHAIDLPVLALKTARRGAGEGARALYPH